MPCLCLINPNTSIATTSMMAERVQARLPPEWTLLALTPDRGVTMITRPEQLRASVAAVLALARSVQPMVDGYIIGAFGDPGLVELRKQVPQPVTGLCEASMVSAAAGQVRFAIATVTPDLVDCFSDTAGRLGLAELYCGTRLTQGDPESLANDPGHLDEALAQAIDLALTHDGAKQVIVGGGPLAAAGERLAHRFDGQLVLPMAAAVDAILDAAPRWRAGCHES